MKRVWLLILGIGFLGNTQAQEDRKFMVKNKAPAYWLPFQLSQARLLEGSPFYHAMKLDQKYLLGMDVNRMLNGYRRRAGLPELGEFPGSNQPKNTRAGEMPHYISAIPLGYLFY